MGTYHQSPTISVSYLTSSISWLIYPALCIRSQQIHMPPTIRTGSRKRSTSCLGGRLPRPTKLVPTISSRFREKFFSVLSFRVSIAPLSYHVSAFRNFVYFERKEKIT